MPYFPEYCFNLIKAYAGIHPAKYHQKKIATMIDSSVKYWKEARLHGETIPLVYEIKFLEQYVEDWENGFPDLRNGEYLRDAIDYRETLATLEDFKFTQSFELYSIVWNNVYSQHSHRLVWLKLTTKPGTVAYSCCSCWPMNVAELKQFCSDNKMPKKKYSNLNKQDLISLIQHYNFD